MEAGRKKNHPLLFPAAGYLAGQVFYNLLPLPYLPFLIAGALLLLASMWLAGKKGFFMPALLALALFCLGTGWLGMERGQALPSGHVSYLANHNYHATEFIVVEASQPNQYGWQVLTEVLAVNGRPASGGMELRGNEKTAPPAVGQQLRANLRLRPISNFANPGGHDWVSQRAIQGVYALAYVSTKANMQLVADRSESLKYLIENIRQYWSKALDQLEAGEARALMRALTLGQRAEATPEQRNNFAILGIAHLLAISGLHLGMVWSFCYLFMRLVLGRFPWLLLRFNVPRLCATCAFCPVFIYALLGGASLPTMRALIMTACLVAGLWINRSYQVIGGLCLAALIICFIWPESLFTISFQLSFTAVCAIVLVAIPLSNFLKSRPGFPRPLAYIAGFMAFTFAIEVFIWPQTVYSFHQVPWLSLLANSIFIPLVGFILLPLSLLAGFVSLIWSYGGYLLFSLAHLLAQYIMLFVNWLAGLPFAVSYIAGPGLFSIILFYLGWLLFFTIPGKKRFYCTATVFTLAFIIWVWPNTQQNGGTLEAWVVDVGQGQAVVAKLPEDRIMVIDCGTTGGMDPGQRIVAPFLWQLGFSQVDILVASHPHPDHYNGLAFLLRWFNPKELWINGYEANDDSSASYNLLLELAEQRGVEVHVLQAPLHENIAGAELKLLWPPLRPSLSNENDLSLWIGLGHNNNWLWLPGDNGPRVEKQIPGFDHAGRHVLVAAHHGGKGSCTTELMQAMKPQTVLFSTGCGNTYGMPRADTLSRVSAVGAQVFSTGNNGCLHLLSSTDGWQIKPFLKTPRACAWDYRQ